MTDVVVAGAGLAGASAALVLARSRHVVVLDAGGPGASGAAAGIVNPYMGRKVRPAWRATEALMALDELLDQAGADDLFRRSGVLRPALSERQRETFQTRSAEHPGSLAWLSQDAVAERWPEVAAPDGALFVREGGHLNLSALVQSFLDAAVARGADLRAGHRLQDWSRDGGHLLAITDHGPIACRHLVLALGDGARQFAALDALPLHRVKGQTLRFARPVGLSADLPAVAGHGYIAPAATSVVVGATFEHTFDSVDPDAALDAGLRAQAARLVPAFADAELVERRAGVRVTIPAAISPGRLPLAGPIPGHNGVWVLTGLGSKGLMTAPFLSRLLPDALDGGRFPADVDMRSVLASRGA